VFPVELREGRHLTIQGDKSRAKQKNAQLLGKGKTRLRVACERQTKGKNEGSGPRGLDEKVKRSSLRGKWESPVLVETTEKREWTFGVCGSVQHTRQSYDLGLLKE